MTIDIVTDVYVRWPKRGISMYPSNGRVSTKWMVKLGDDKRWRRVYDRCAEASSHTDGTRTSARFVPVVRGLDGEFRDLTTDESALVGYDFHEARR